MNGPNSWTKGQKGLHGFPRASTSFYKVSTGLALSFHGFPIGIPQGFRGVGQGCSSYVFLSHFIRFFPSFSAGAHAQTYYVVYISIYLYLHMYILYYKYSHLLDPI